MNEQFCSREQNPTYVIYLNKVTLALIKQYWGDEMEKTGEIKPGVTPEVTGPVKQACAMRPGRRKPFALTERIKQLEEDAVARLIKKASKK